MPRIARWIEPNGYYHVISRSSNEDRILKDDEDFHHFLVLEAEAKKRSPIRLFHYVLMNTHFHFVVQTPDKDTLSQHIARLKWHYTLWMRKKYGWKGPLWRERYKSLIIESESYLNMCGNYIEYNPVRAGMCKTPAEYPYSSYRKYNQGMEDPLLDPYDPGPPLNQVALLEFQIRLARELKTKWVSQK